MQIQALREQERRAAAEARRLELIERQEQEEAEVAQAMKMMLGQAHPQRQQAPRQHHRSYQLPERQHVQRSYSQEGQDDVFVILGDLLNTVCGVQQPATAPAPTPVPAPAPKDVKGKAKAKEEPEHVDLDRQIAQQLQERYSQEADEEVSSTIRNLLSSLGGDGVAGPSKPTEVSSKPKEDVKAEEGKSFEDRLGERLRVEQDTEIAETLKNIWSAFTGEHLSSDKHVDEAKGKGKEKAVEPEVPDASEQTENGAAKMLRFWHSRQARVSSLRAIGSIQSSLHALERSFVLPDHLDFLPSSDLAYSSTNTPVREYEHALNGLLGRLDEVVSDGDEEVRGRRKSAVQEVEKALETLSGMVRSVWTATHGDEVEETVRIPVVDGPMESQAVPAQDAPVAEASTAAGVSLEQDAANSEIAVEVKTSESVEAEDPAPAEGDIPSSKITEEETVNFSGNVDVLQHRLQEPAGDAVLTEQSSSDLPEQSSKPEQPEVAYALEVMESVPEVDASSEAEEQPVEASAVSVIEEHAHVETKVIREDSAQTDGSFDVAGASTEYSDHAPKEDLLPGEEPSQSELQEPARRTEEAQPQLEDVDTFLLPAHHEETQKQRQESDVEDLVVVKEEGSDWSEVEA
ncbi:hypothetical protein OE88DRAFT_1810506 [Heliocybe sulcata]|uniref:BAG domain-containing protein n=1 Tax=Heliocybe sulcata TaxID=5364 RepID=A0A5C3MUQ3_9AGAM|nr:hypothetical protein OE88DRAFT_1810506 [Heliocybe sulcata]